MRSQNGRYVEILTYMCLRKCEILWGALAMWLDHQTLGREDHCLTMWLDHQTLAREDQGLIMLLDHQTLSREDRGLTLWLDHQTQ